jgi:2-dehydropantoate 2-reductase
MGKVTIEDNFVGARWSKLIVNSAFSTLSAVTGLTFGQISKNHTARRLAQSILKEGMDVAFANGITPAKIQGHDLVKFLYYRGPVKKLISFALIPIAMKKHKLLVSGMYYDLKNGKQCDVDFVCGVVEKYGEIAFVATPTCSVAIKLIKDIENGKCQISPKNIVVLKNELAH